MLSLSSKGRMQKEPQRTLFLIEKTKAAVPKRIAAFLCPLKIKPAPSTIRADCSTHTPL